MWSVLLVGLVLVVVPPQQVLGQSFNWYDFIMGRDLYKPPPQDVDDKPTEKAVEVREELQYVSDVGLDEQVFNDEDYERRIHPVRYRKLPVDMFCKQEKSEALKMFCFNMTETDYYDPWNPYCGFIRCSYPVSANGVRQRNLKATRELCSGHTWISDQDALLRKGRDNICRVPLRVGVAEGNRCLGGVVNIQNHICDAAKRVLLMNDKTSVANQI